MIHELRTYTFAPGKVQEFLKLVDEIGRPARGDDYGKMEGYWYTEHGPLNQVFHLWSHNDLNSRQENRKRLSQNEAWIKEFLPKALPLIVGQHVRLMHPNLKLKLPSSRGNVYEYRYYRTVTGKAQEFIDGMCNVMHVREKYSQNVCVWRTEASEPNEASHLWVYDDLKTRLEQRASAANDPEFQAFLKKGAALIQEMHSVVLIPTAFSPLG